MVVSLDSSWFNLPRSSGSTLYPHTHDASIPNANPLRLTGRPRMVSIATAIGLRTAGASWSPPSASIPNYGPACIIFHFIFAYGVLSSRTLKQYYGIDHNESPREDLAKYGVTAVQEGKLTQKQLDMLKRNESAHANAVENFSLLIASITFASLAGVQRQTINAAALTYTVARVAYGGVYIFISNRKWSQLRGLTWWTGNLSCLYLLWRAGKELSA
jgi:uncharacterized MAPEG superfamily protein